MDKSLKDKTVVVTGGAGGIGFEIVNHVLEVGAKTVVILDLNEIEGIEAAKKLNVLYGENKAAFIQCDVTKDLETVSKRIFSTIGTVDVLVNNAGIALCNEWKKCIDVNLTYLIGWSLAFWEHMRKDKGGKGGTIINMSSIYGYTVDQFFSVYIASKFGVLGFSRSLGHEYNFKKTGVRVVALCPSFTQTALVQGSSTSQSIDYFGEDLPNHMMTKVWQTPDAVGKAAVDIYEKAESGEAWTVEGGKPIEKVV